MEFINIIFSSIGSVAALFILTKIMGNRQMSQLSMFDYITGITIGSIAAEMATSLENDFMKPLIAMMIYALISVLFSFATTKSIMLRRLLTGETIILYNEGKLYKKNLKMAKLDISEFLTQCRNNGYFDLSNIQTAMLEPNGKVSFLLKSEYRPIMPYDLNMKPAKEKPVANVILDGKLLPDNLKFTGNDENWLKKQLRIKGVHRIEDVFLATCDSNNKLNVYLKLDEKMSRDMFE